MNALVMAGILAVEGEPNRDDDGQIVTHSWILPDPAELIFGTLASILIFALLFKFAGPPVKKAFVARTERIQGELASAAKTVEDADADAARIRAAKGDIDGERTRLFAEADAQAEALLRDGRERLEREVAEMEERAEAELAAGANRLSDEMRAEIARIVQHATDRVVADTLDRETGNQLVENFIQRVGASS